MVLGIQYAGSDRLGHDPSFVSEYSTSVGYVLYYGYGLIWRPYLRDSIVPFIIGIQEFMLVTLIGEEFNTLLLYVLGTIFISGNWVSHSSLRRARQDPENAEFFGQVEPATLRDFWPAMTIVSCLAVSLSRCFRNFDRCDSESDLAAITSSYILQCSTHFSNIRVSQTVAWNYGL